MDSTGFLMAMAMLGGLLFTKLLFTPHSRRTWALAVCLFAPATMISLKAGQHLSNFAFPLIAVLALIGLVRDGGKTKVPYDGAAGEGGAISPRAERGRGFAAVAGMQELKTKLMEAAKEAMKRGSKQVRNGILLYGDPGNGKTFMIEALAQELRVPLITMTLGDVQSMWIGERDLNVMERVRKAKNCAPCILFIDEADSLLESRDRASSSNVEMVYARTTNTLLTELVNLRGSGVLVVAATNFLDKLDAAAIREGRFDFKIEVPPPDEPARIGLLKSGLERHARDIQIAPDVVESAAKRWRGFSVKRILAITEQIPSYVKRTGKTALTYDDLIDVLRDVQGAKARIPEGTKTLDQMVLMPEQRVKLQALAQRLHKSFEIEQAGGTLPTGLLFYGPPGTGKTETARALAKASGWAFTAVSGNDLLHSPQLIDKLHRDAMKPLSNHILPQQSTETGSMLASSITASSH